MAVFLILIMTIWNSGGITQACMATTRLCSTIMVRGDTNSRWIARNVLHNRYKLMSNSTRNI